MHQATTRITFSCLLLCLFQSPVLGQDAAAPTEPPFESDSKKVRKGINHNFVAADLKVEEWLGRFEIESREAFAARDEVLLSLIHI